MKYARRLWKKRKRKKKKRRESEKKNNETEKRLKNTKKIRYAYIRGGVYIMDTESIYLHARVCVRSGKKKNIYYI